MKETFEMYKIGTFSNNLPFQYFFLHCNEIEFWHRGAEKCVPYKRNGEFGNRSEVLKKQNKQTAN